MFKVRFILLFLDLGVFMHVRIFSGILEEIICLGNLLGTFMVLNFKAGGMFLFILFLRRSSEFFDFAVFIPTFLLMTDECLM